MNVSERNSMYNKYSICHKPSKGILMDFKTQGKAKGFWIYEDITGYVSKWFRKSFV